MTYNLRSAFSCHLTNQPYNKSKSPYKNALMKGLIKPKFKNRDYHYYRNLGDKINQIVEEHCQSRSYRYWWIEEYIREANINKDNTLIRKNYVVC